MASAAKGPQLGEVMEKLKPRLAKAHSSYIANLYVQAGWTIRTEFRVREDEEPYEYILEWLRDGEPVRPELPRDDCKEPATDN